MNLYFTKQVSDLYKQILRTETNKMSYLILHMPKCIVHDLRQKYDTEIHHRNLC